MPIKGRIAFGDRLELVVEVNDYFAQRHIKEQLHSVTGDIFLLDQFASFVETERHNRSDKSGCGDDGRTDIRFFDMVDNSQVRHSGRIMYFHLRAVFEIDVITYVRHGGDNVHIELAVQALLHNLHVEKSEEAAAETKAKRNRRLGSKGKR